MPIQAYIIAAVVACVFCLVVALQESKKFYDKRTKIWKGWK